MGRKAIKIRKQEAKAKKRAGQNSSAPAASPPASLPASPPASPRAAAHAVPETGVRTGTETHTVGLSKEPAGKVKKGPRIAASDRVTRFRGASADTPPQPTSDDTRGMSRATAAPKLFQPQENFLNKGDEASDKLRPVQKSSVAIRTLLQQITSDPNVEEDLAPYISGEDEDEGTGDDDRHKKNHHNSDDDGEDDSEDDVVEIQVRLPLSPD
jgi:hypothetical protein